MKVDMYTKAMLTVIACCLLYFVARDLSVVQDAHAQSRGVVEVNIVQVAGVRIASYDALPVKIK